jgi:hypothetical protein
VANEQRLLDLAKRLIQATEDSKAHWTAQRATSFILALPSGAVTIRSNDGTAPFWLTVYDDDGNSIESLGTGYVEGTLQPEPWNEPLARLYELARNRALNIDEVLDRLIAEAENPPPSADDDIPF